MISPLHHIALSVQNLEESIEWYRIMFGCAREKEFEIPGKGQAIFINNGKVRLELFCLQDAQELPEYRKDIYSDLMVHGTKHICFAVEDIQKSYRELQEKGCEIVMQPKIGNSGGTYFFVKDPTGNLIEMCMV